MSLLGASRHFLNERFHALTHKDFRYFWIGQCVSLVGTWMQNIGQSWLVLTLTGSPFLLGLVGTVQFLPVTFFSLFAGVVIDKFPKRNILLVTQSVSMALAFILAALVFTGHVRYGYIVALALILGFTNNFDMPTRQAFTIEIVGKEDLMNAIALNSTTFNLARIVGPAIGASMMALFGAGWCFLLNGLSFIAVICGLLHIKAKPYVRVKKEGAGVLKEIKDGIAYIARDKVLSEIILLLIVISTLAYNFNVLIPSFTKNVLHMQEKTYGILMSCVGFGSLAAALSVSMRSKGGPKLGRIMLASVASAISLILTGLTHNAYFTGLALALTGFCNIIFSTNCNSMLQMHAKDEYRARVMSVYALVFTGSTPLGNFLSGYVADRYGADGAFLVCGIFAIIPVAAIILFFKRRRAEPQMKAQAETNAEA